MSRPHDRLTPELLAFIQRQKVFFVATAPLAAQGRVNLSPKGYDSLVVLDERTLAYLDLGGSGIETQAHLQENGRITLMWCAFEGRPDVVRVYGQGEAVALHDPRFPQLLARFPGHDRARAVILVHVARAADSCGWGVPLFDYKGEREQLQRWVDAKPFEAWAEGRYRQNARSIDGLPGLVRPPASTE